MCVSEGLQHGVTKAAAAEIVFAKELKPYKHRKLESTQRGQSSATATQTSRLVTLILDHVKSLHLDLHQVQIKVVM